MKQNIYFLLLLLLGATLPAYAQQATIKGVVQDSLKEGEILYGAVISIDGGASSVTTSFADGSFSIQLEPGEHTLESSFLGYQDKKTTIRVDAGQELEVNLLMNETGVMALMDAPTVTSSKFEKPLGEVTVSLEVVSPEFLENTNATSVDQAVDKVPGVNMLGDQIDIRGGAGWAQGTGSRVLVLLDDMPAFQADGGIVHWKDLPTENIAQMEVLKGAASALYGSAALSGILNIRTAYPTKKPYTKISLYTTIYDNPPANIDSAGVSHSNKWWDKKTQPFEAGIQFAHRRKMGKNNKWDLVSGGNFFWNSSYIRGNNFFDSIPDTLPAYDRRGRATINLKYQASEKISFGINTNLNIGAKNEHLFWNRNAGQNLYFAEASSIPIRGKSIRFTIDPSMTAYDNKENRHRLQTRYYYIDNNNENNQSNNSHHVYAEYQFMRKFEKLGGLELVAGAVGSFTDVSAEVYGNEQFYVGNFGAYLQLDKKFFDRLSLSAGFRLELNDMQSPDSVLIGFDRVATSNQFEGKPILRFGANYKITEGTFFRASWGQAYRYPTILEKFISTSAGGFIVIHPSPSLQSETGWSAEVGVKQGFKITEKWQGYIDVAGFWTEYQNMMEFQFVNTTQVYGFQVNNVGDTRVRGFDVSLMGQGTMGPVKVDLMAGYTYISPTYQDFKDSTIQADIVANSTSDQNILKYRYRHSVKFDGQATFKGISLGYTLQYFSVMEAIDKYLYSNFPSIAGFRDSHDQGTLIMNARIACNFGAFTTNKLPVKLSFLAQNILNTEYSMRPGILSAPRNFAIRADITF